MARCVVLDMSRVVKASASSKPSVFSDMTYDQFIHLRHTILDADAGEYANHVVGFYFRYESNSSRHAIVLYDYTQSKTLATWYET